jgi:hypothetical protein
VEQMIDDDEDLREYVERIESMDDDAFGIDNPNQLEFDFEEDVEDDVDDNIDTLVDEVEKFLRDQDPN